MITSSNVAFTRTAELSRRELIKKLHISKTCTCNKTRFFFSFKNIFVLFLLKT